jgi:hypothetical protein
VVISAALSELISARIQVNVDAEPDREQQRGRVDVIEAFVRYSPVLSPHLRMRFRGGVFFPPVSLENTGLVWSTPYTITTSAVNSWIGEEVRPTGAEMTLQYSKEATEFAITAAAFGNNDPTGSLLAWRGWALHDRQTGLSDRLPLAPIPAFGPQGLFPQQPPYAQPFREVDGRLGYYTAASLKHQSLEINGIYFDNRGTQTDFDGSQYSWETDFFDAGLRFSLPANFELLGQYLQGTSRMGVGSMVNIDFYSAYGLLTTSFGRNRMTLRYDDFSVEDHDVFQFIDDNEECGSAWTLAYILQTGEKHRLAFEFLRVESERAVLQALGFPDPIEELLFQISFRIQF